MIEKINWKNSVILDFFTMALFLIAALIFRNLQYIREYIEKNNLWRPCCYAICNNAIYPHLDSGYQYGYSR